MSTNKNLYALRDLVAGEIINYFVATNHGEAIRFVDDFVRYQPNHLIAKHPKDFQLICVQEVDNLAMAHVANLADLINVPDVPGSKTINCDDAPVAVEVKA